MREAVLRRIGIIGWRLYTYADRGLRKNYRRTEGRYDNFLNDFDTNREIELYG